MRARRLATELNECGDGVEHTTDFCIQLIMTEEGTRLGFWVLELEDKVASEVQIRFGFQ